MRERGWRGLVCGVMAAGLLAAGQVEAAQRCATSSQQAVFDLEALKSELIVLATACKTDAQYNAFVHRFQTSLAENEHAFSEYFRQTYGKRSQSELDTYITLMANEQFNAGLKQGSDFCPRNMALYEEAMALDGPTQLAEYAAGKALFPATLGACAAPPVAVADSSAGRSKNTRHASR